MQVIIELIAGFLALLAAVALAQFGVDLHTPRQADREIHRTADCADKPATGITAAPVPSLDC